MQNSKNLKPRVPALFLDRDGVLNEDDGYVYKPSQFKLVDGIIPLLNAAKSLSYLLIVITNQSGIARGMYTVDQMREFNVILGEKIIQEGGPKLDAIYWCPHLPDGKIKVYSAHCICRKPGPGMILAAAEYHRIDLAKSFMIGDKASDMEAAQAAKVRGIQVGSGDASELASAHVLSLAQARAIISSAT